MARADGRVEGTVLATAVDLRCTAASTHSPMVLLAGERGGDDALRDRGEVGDAIAEKEGEVEVMGEAR